jgi:hypothetical protein
VPLVLCHPCVCHLAPPPYKTPDNIIERAAACTYSFASNEVINE